MLVSSKPIIEELVKTLKSFRIQMDDVMIAEWRKMIVENSMMVESSEKLEIIWDDPDDNKFLEAALVGNAEYIIS